MFAYEGERALTTTFPFITEFEKQVTRKPQTLHPTQPTKEPSNYYGTRSQDCMLFYLIETKD